MGENEDPLEKTETASSKKTLGWEQFPGGQVGKKRGVPLSNTEEKSEVTMRLQGWKVIGEVISHHALLPGLLQSGGCERHHCTCNCSEIYSALFFEIQAMNSVRHGAPGTLGVRPFWNGAL